MTRQPPDSTYDDDFYAWTQEQAEALRRMPAPSGDVDVAHLAEEIEDLGKRDLREVVSYLTLLIEHLVKMEGLPNSRDIAHWGSEVAHFQRSARSGFSPSMRRLLDLENIWQEGRDTGEQFLRDVGREVVALRGCPFLLGELLAPKFDKDAALARISASRAANRHP